ncbi:response regulator [Lusitaniella coriacea LEGE 07157]|uniref:Circadian input-output histidine kinase CikA n=1 Tax=Lusitaniella coriacea LEGE 07157 TaxID=945747 RepID=A0A8J7DVB6_9CYAN|nr:response regulator [Lusitaniella coriacea]MBE9115677.1 response regulator [Lusitaniella coriacea LEGE 07157]
MTVTQGNILIVDDRPENLQVLSQTLAEQGYKVRGAVKGEMGIRAAISNPPDLILLDIKMPKMDGFTVCKRLKENPKTRDIPIIFLSALDETLDKVQGFTLGGVDYITKPFQIEEVLARVETQIKLRRLQQQLQQQNQQLQEEIKERRKAEKAAAAASKAKSEFLANMSHELRTPLNIILGFAKLMNRDASLSLEQHENLQTINRSGEHLLELISDILELSKIESGIISLDEKDFDLYHLLDNLEEMFLVATENKEIELRFSIASDVPQYIKADEKKLRSCLINLLSNALKFTPAGYIKLRVSACRESEPFHILFEVEDTGVGIDRADLENVFDAFVQAQAGRQSAEGTGLGLSITRKFAQLMGGDITANSAIDRGSTFKLHIQLTPVPCPTLSLNPRQRPVALVSEEACRVLVVDDTQDNRRLLVKLLEPIGFEVREGDNGFEGIEQWENWQPHLIWMDTRMPVMDGLEATRQIRQREGLSSEKKQTVIIALTASAFAERREEILTAGFDDLLFKPFRENVLFETMAEYLGIRYRYEELPPMVFSRKRDRDRAASNPLFLGQLEEMPLSWIARLAQAANEVNEDLMIELIKEIPDNRSILTEGIKDLFDDSRLDIILRLARKVLED